MGNVIAAGPGQTRRRSARFSVASRSVSAGDGEQGMRSDADGHVCIGHDSAGSARPARGGMRVDDRAAVLVKEAAGIG